MGERYQITYLSPRRRPMKEIKKDFREHINKYNKAVKR